jgi:hypothetical protein
VTGREIAWTSIVVAALAALIVALHGIDRQRASRELRALEASVCDVAIPASTIRALGWVHSPAARLSRAKELRSTVERLQRRLASGGHLLAFFEADGVLWSLGTWSGPDPDAGGQWPQAVGRWEHVAWRPGCRSVLDDSNLRVARTLPVPGGFVVLVATRWRST